MTKKLKGDSMSYKIQKITLTVAGDEYTGDLLDNVISAIHEGNKEHDPELETHLVQILDYESADLYPPPPQSPEGIIFMSETVLEQLAESGIGTQVDTEKIDHVLLALENLAASTTEVREQLESEKKERANEESN